LGVWGHLWKQILSSGQFFATEPCRPPLDPCIFAVVLYS
jgi:hypothetical protein